MTVYSEEFAGQTVVINDVVVEFAASGVCRGIVAYDGGLQPVNEPQPLRPQDLDVMRQFPQWYHIEDDSPGPPADEANEGAADAPADAEDSRDGPEAPARTTEGDVEELLALYSRDELAQIAKEVGLHVTSRTTKRKLAEMIAGGRE